MFNQRACVARIDQVLFCPTGADAPITYDSLLHIAATASSHDDDPMDLDDDREDGPGGVPLPDDNDDDHDIRFHDIATVQTNDTPRHQPPGPASHIPRPPPPTTHPQPVLDPHIVPPTGTHQIVDSVLDDDGLGVDDPLRHYDVADFIDTWRLRSRTDRRLPPFEPGIQPSLRLAQSRPATCKEVTSGAVDMQGLRWTRIGPSRKHATFARRLLHPSPSFLPPRAERTRHTSEERHYGFRSYNPKHRARFTHYQLRHLLTSSSRSELFYSTGDQVMCASLACPEVTEPVMDFSNSSTGAADFRITCLAASQREALSSTFLLAGGFYGEYALLNVDAEDRMVHQGFVTHAYNGLVTHVHPFPDRRSGLPQAAFCSNDHSMTLMDISTARFTTTFRYDFAINAAATSPDGRLRALVGDARDVLIADASHGRPLVVLNGQNDHGFACAWSADGRYVAAAAQDGKTLVWDARNWSTPTATLYTSMSCARSLHFTDHGALVIAENDDVVRIYDAGSFSTCQDITFFGSIAGVTLLNGGAEMVVANADKTIGGLLTFDRSGHGYSAASLDKSWWAAAGGASTTTTKYRQRRRRARQESLEMLV